jgi:8-oxo-dGTP pyrophosphatase MutT (NUDIX family)
MVAVAASLLDGKLVCVRDPKRRAPLWKFPGGKSEPWEEGPFSSQEAKLAMVGEIGRRELLEEAGIEVSPRLPFELIYHEERNGHEYFMIHFFLPSIPKDFDSPEGMEVVCWTPQEVDSCKQFHPAYKRSAEKLLRPLPAGMERPVRH